MTRWCQFCRAVIQSVSPSGTELVVRAFVSYAGKAYCAEPCFGKLREVARRTGGIL